MAQDITRLAGIVRSSKKVIPLLTLMFLVCQYGCSGKSQNKTEDEKPVYTGCIVLCEQGDGYYTLGYEVHLKSPLIIMADTPVGYFKDFINPEDWIEEAAYSEGVNEETKRYCEAEGYHGGDRYEFGLLKLNAEEIPALVNFLEALPFNISFQEKETGNIYEYKEPLPVIVISQKQ